MCAVWQLGDGTNTQRNTPITVPGITISAAGIIDAGKTRGYVCAVQSSGAVSCWGINDQGQLGVGNTQNRLSPTGSTGR